MVHKSDPMMKRGSWIYQQIPENCEWGLSFGLVKKGVLGEGSIHSDSDIESTSPGTSRLCLACQQRHCHHCNRSRLYSWLIIPCIHSPKLISTISARNPILATVTWDKINNLIYFEDSIVTPILIDKLLTICILMAEWLGMCETDRLLTILRQLNMNKVCSYCKRPNRHPEHGESIKTPSGWRGEGAYIKAIYKLGWYIGAWTAGYLSD